MKLIYKISLVGGLGLAALGFVGRKYDVLPEFSTTTDIDTVKVVAMEQKNVACVQPITGYNVSNSNVVVGMATGTRTKTQVQMVSKKGEDIVFDFVPDCAADSVVFPQVGDEMVLQRDTYCLGKMKYWSNAKYTNNITQQKLKSEYLTHQK